MTQALRYLFFAFLLASCADGYTTFPVEPQQQEKMKADVQIIRLSAKNIHQYAESARPTRRAKMPRNTTWSYRIGVGDILSITVYDHPELTMPAGPDRSPADNGFRVEADGAFYYPHIGQVRADGRTIDEIRNEVSQRLRVIIPEPQVVARVAEFNSQSVIVGGEVNSPKTQQLNTVPLTLFEAINAAGGFTDEADLSRITLQRGGQRYIIDLEGYLKTNYGQNNPILRAGDVVNVPEYLTEEAYILGEVVEPNVVDLAEEPVNLTQALTYREGLNEVRADARGIFVFRQVAGKVTVYQLETNSPEGWLLGTRFTLRPEDVVYVTRSPLVRWNDTVSRILPTILAIDAIDSIVDF